MKSDVLHIGVDVSKDKLDVYNPITHEIISLKNEADGFRKIKALARKTKAIVCCEPTGGYELDMVLFLQHSNISVAYCDGYRVRHYALSTGQFSKNDSLDAKLISQYADNTPIRIIETKDIKQLGLKNRWKLYKTFMDFHVTLARKASSEHDKNIKDMLRTDAKRFEKKALKVIDKCIEIIKSDERMTYLYERFIEIDGVADKSAIAIIAGLPEIGKISNEAITKLVGIAPMDHQSGEIAHSKSIYGGRKDVRNALYMATVAAVQHNHILKAYYHQLKERIPTNMASKWALVPVMRKLLHLMNKLANNPNFQLQVKPITNVA